LSAKKINCTFGGGWAKTLYIVADRLRTCSLRACFFIADNEENVSIKVVKTVSFILRNFATYGLQRRQF